jgi:hypothetical protein
MRREPEFPFFATVQRREKPMAQISGATNLIL